ncbi:Methyl-CpG-binding domain-containing protein 7 [Linum grandiflorum]
MELQSSSRITVQIPKLSPDNTTTTTDIKPLHIQAYDPSAPLHILPPDHTVSSIPAAASSPGRFQLPEGWIVEKRRRRFDSFGGSPVVDKRYISGGRESEAKFKAVRSPRHEKDNMQIVPSVYDDGSQLGLPSGWLVEIRPRSDPSKFDKYYIEPQSGTRFRSLPDVHRYLNEEEGYLSRKDRNNMQVVPSVYDDGSRLGLPSGWRVELRPRSDRSRFDKYYIEPWTGRRFRSIPDVHRYLNEDMPIPIKSRHDHDNVIQMQTVSSVFKSGSQFELPCDWVVELRPRSDGSKLDKYYIEPGTERKFRSLVAVQKHIKEAEMPTTGLKALIPMVYTTKDNVTGKVKKFKRIADVGKTSELTMQLRTRHRSLVETEETRAVKPTRINWVFSGQRESAWSPSIDGSPVPDSEVRGWSDAFVLSMDSQ